MNTFKLPQGFAFAISLLISISILHGQTTALDFVDGATGLGSNVVFAKTLGWEFELSSTVEVRRLGLFDDGQNGLAESHQIGIWNLAGVLQVQGTLAAGVGGIIDGKFRFTDVSPTILQPGRYAIGAFYSLNSRDRLPQDPVSATTATGITFIQTRSSSTSGFVFPNVQQGGINHFGPNFQFVADQTDIIATSLKWDSTADAFIYEYKITGSDLTVPLNVDLYWAKGPTLNDSPTLAYTTTFTDPTDLSANTHTKGVLFSDLTALPPDATHLLLVVDPPDATHPTGQIAESDEGNNVFPLPVGVDLLPISADLNLNPDFWFFSYRVLGTIPKRPTVVFAWASGPDVEKILLEAFRGQFVDVASGDHPQIVSRNLIKGAPLGTTHLLVITDPDNVIQESDEQNNVFEVPVAFAPTLELFVSQTTVMGQNYELMARIVNYDPQPRTYTLSWQEHYQLQNPPFKEQQQGTVTSVTVAATSQLEITLGTFNHNWDWIPQRNPLESGTDAYKSALFSILKLPLEEILGKPGRYLDNLHDVLDVIFEAISDVQAATPSKLIDYTAVLNYGNGNAGANIATKVEVPFSKKSYYGGFISYSAAASFTTSAAIASGRRSVAISLALAIAEIADLETAEFFYDQAADPPDPNYKQLTVATPFVIPELNALNESAWKEYALTALQLSALKKAEAVSRNRAQGAGLAADFEWQSKQLFASASFASQAVSVSTRLIELQTFLDVVLNQLTPADWPSVQATLATDGLPKIEIKYLSSLGWSPAKIENLRKSLMGLGPDIFSNPKLMVSALQIGSLVSANSVGEDLQSAIQIRTNKLGFVVRDLTDQERRVLDDTKAVINAGLAKSEADPALLVSIEAFLAQVRLLIEQSNNFHALEDYFNFGQTALAAFQKFATQVPSPRSVKTNVRNELRHLRVTLRNQGDREKIEDAIEHLRKALKSKLWRDETHLDLDDGDEVFDEEREAVDKLSDLLKDKKSKIPDAVLQGFIDRLVFCDRLLASTAIQDAIASGKHRDVKKAQEDFADAEEDANEGRWEAAIKNYADAWEHATDAISRNR